MQKRGVSGIIAAVLIVLVGVGGLAVTWTFVDYLLSGAIDSAEQQVEFLSSRLEIVSESLELNESSGDVSFLLERLPGGERLDGFLIVLTDVLGNSVTIREYENTPLAELERIRVSFTFDPNELEDLATISLHGILIETDEQGNPVVNVEPIMSNQPLAQTVIRSTGGGGGGGSSGTENPSVEVEPDTDTDTDGIIDSEDNCPTVANPDQQDVDEDGIGDVCEDADSDGVFDPIDNCPNDANSNQLDSDSDGEGDVCDTDSDNDGVLNINDNCPTDPSYSNEPDADSDGIGDACDYYPNYATEEMKPFFALYHYDTNGNRIDSSLYRSNRFDPVSIVGTFGEIGYIREYIREGYFIAQVEYLGNDEYRLEIENTHPTYTLRAIRFPWEETLSKLGPDKTDDITYYPQLMGYNEVHNPALAQYAWRGGIPYPGLSVPLFIIWDNERARLIAATNYDGEGLEPKIVTPQYDGLGVSFAYPDILLPGETRAFHLTDAYIEDFDQTDGIEPWHRAADIYHNWLKNVQQQEDIIPRDHYDPFLKNVHGWYARMLMNSISYSATNDETLTQRIWPVYKDILPWVQVWGQMSNYAGFNRSLAQPPLPPGEITGCCLFNRTMHYRYLETEQGVTPYPDVAQEVSDDDGWVGYYVRPLNDDSGNQLDLTDTQLYSDRDAVDETPLEYLQNWIDKTYVEYNANTQYIDVLAAGSGYGSPLDVARLFRDRVLPINGSVEGVTDVYPVAFMASGSLAVSDPTLSTIGPGFSLENTNSQPAPHIGRYLLRDHIFFLGQTNTDNALWFGDEDGFVQDFDHWGIRQAFLLGAKFDVQHPFYSWDDVTVIQPPFADAIDARDDVDSATGPTGTSWWSYEPAYLDTYGVIVQTPGVDVRRFEGLNGEVLLSIENWQRLPDVTLSVDGVQRTIVFEEDFDQSGLSKRFVTYLWE